MRKKVFRPFLVVLFVAATLSVSIVYADSGADGCFPGQKSRIGTCICWDPAELRWHCGWVEGYQGAIDSMVRQDLIMLKRKQEAIGRSVSRTSGLRGGGGISIPSSRGNKNFLLLVGALVAGYLYLKNQSKGRRG